MSIEELNLHDAVLEAAQVGPRRELVLQVFVPEATAASERAASLRGRTLAIRFGGIENYGDVERFFANGPAQGRDAHVSDTIMNLRRTAAGWVLELDQRGSVMINTRKVPTTEETVG
jgi:hypothetical protein